MEHLEFIQRILFVIVIYQRQIDDVLQKVLPFLGSSANVLIYDNSPQKQFSRCRSVNYIHDPDNGGLSRAYNAAFDLARDRQCRWLMLLDQDTVCTDGYLSALAHELDRVPDSAVIVPILTCKGTPISPFRWRFGRGWKINAKPGAYPLTSYRFANSGALISFEAFDRARGYNEKIKLDFADISFGERMSGLVDNFVTVGIELEHEFSGSMKMPLNAALKRYALYCRDALMLEQEFGERFLIRSNTVLRACKLAAQYRSFAFVKVYLKTR